MSTQQIKDEKQKVWPLLVACLLPPLALLIFIVIADDWKLKYASLMGKDKDCKQHHVSGGFVRKTMTLARMSAITSWMKEVQAHGQDYSLWTNADRKLLRCKKINGTDYINCVARATPCKLIYDRVKEQERLLALHKPVKVKKQFTDLKSLLRNRSD